MKLAWLVLGMGAYGAGCVNECVPASLRDNDRADEDFFACSDDLCTSRRALAVGARVVVKLSLSDQGGAIEVENSDPDVIAFDDRGEHPADAERCPARQTLRGEVRALTAGTAQLRARGGGSSGPAVSFRVEEPDGLWIRPVPEDGDSRGNSDDPEREDEDLDDIGRPLDRIEAASLWTTGARRELEVYLDPRHEREPLVAGDSVEWSADHPEIVLVRRRGNGSAIARGLAAGSATVTAQLGERQRSFSLTVEAPPSAGL